MPDASYLQANDYAPQDFKPFQMPYSATLQELATKNAYWQQGAQKIKSAFDAVLGLDPQFTQHKEYLKQFTEQANKQLTIAGKSDLAQDDNVGAAIAIFKPLYDTTNPFNQNLLTDSQTNEFYKAQVKLSNAARSTDGGKNWNKNNDFYMQSGYQKYMDDAKTGDVNKVKENWSQKKGFIPYVDAADGITQAIKNCHESSSKTTIADNNGYLNTTSNKGISSQSMEGCMSFLPENIKQQIGIDSYAKYYGNKAGLLNDYQQLVYNGAKEKRDAIGANLAAATIKKDKNKIAYYTTAFKQADDSYKQGEAMYTRMLGKKTGEEFINTNYENIASVVGFNHFTARAGKVFSWSDVQNVLSPDASWIAKQKMNNDVKLQNAEFVHAERMQASKFGYDSELLRMKIAGDNATNGTNGVNEIITNSVKGAEMINPKAPDTENAEAKSLENMDVTLKALTTESEGLSNLVGSYINTHAGTSDANTNKAMNALYAGINNKKVSQTQLINFLNTYQKSGGVKDDKIEKAILNIRQLNQSLQSQSYTHDLAAAKVKNIDVSKYSDKRDINIDIPDENGNKIMLTEQELRKIAGGQTIKGVSTKFIPGMLDAPNHSLQYTDKNGKTTTWGDYNDGKNAAMFQGAFPDTRIASIFNDAENGRKERDALFVDNTLEQDGIYTIGGNQKQLDAINVEIVNKRIGGQALLNDYDVHVIKRKDNGTVYAQVTKKGKAGEDGTVLTKTQLGQFVNSDNGVTVQSIGSKGTDGTYYLEIPNVLKPLEGAISGANAVRINKFTKVWMDKLAVGQSSSDNMFANEPYNHFETQTPAGRAIQVDITKIGGKPTYTIKMDNNGTYVTLPKTYDSDAEVLVAINNLKF